jgi:hypothetical protein
MAITKTSIHAGEIISDILSNDEAVKSLAKRIFPVAITEATLPYIVYRREESSAIQTNSGHASETVSISVYVYTAEYAEGVELAEAVRAALHGARYDNDGLQMRSCVFDGCGPEDWLDDAFVQQLNFRLKIN